MLASTLVHAGVEMITIELLVSDFERYGLSLSWGVWYMVHHIGAAVLLALGVFVGYRQGIYWWKRIYGK